jgi:glyoxylase-like metal-dependent hydrolase (beta-lactamase superfamily II)
MAEHEDIIYGMDRGLMAGEGVSTRVFGDVEVSVLHLGHIHWKPTNFPGDWAAGSRIDDEGRAVMGINTMVIRKRDVLVIVDPVSIAPEDSTAPWSELVGGPDLDAALAAAGVSAEDVTHVVITHGHPDHYTGVLRLPRDAGQLRFPNAEHFFPREDWPRFITEPPELPPGHSHRQAPVLMLPVQAAGKLRLVRGNHEVAPGISLLHTPGETPGHQVVWIDTDDRPVAYMGDLFHLPPELANVDWTPLDRDYTGLRESRLRILHAASESKAAVALTHGQFPPWGQVERAGDAYRWRYDDAGARAPA